MFFSSHNKLTTSQNSSSSSSSSSLIIGLVCFLSDMGSDKGRRFDQGGKMKELMKLLKMYTDCLWSFLVSLAGGVLLAWWEYEYHPENRQLWMVPFGLVLFFTPLIIWIAIFVSDICTSTDCVTRPDGSIHRDPEKVMIKPVISTS